MIAVAAIAAILWLSRDEAGNPGPGDAASGAARSEPGAPVAMPGAGAALPDPASAPAPTSPAPKEWDQVSLAVRLSDLGPPLARSVYDGLQRARAALEPCFEADARDAAARPRAPEEEDPWGAAILTLQMEGGAGEILIVGAPLQSIGTSSMLLAECAERVLRGFRIPAPGAVPGQRYRLQYQLIQ